MVECFKNEKCFNFWTEYKKPLIEEFLKMYDSKCKECHPNLFCHGARILKNGYCNVGPNICKTCGKISYPKTYYGIENYEYEHNSEYDGEFGDYCSEECVPFVVCDKCGTKYKEYYGACSTSDVKIKLEDLF